MWTFWQTTTRHVRKERTVVDEYDVEERDYRKTVRYWASFLMFVFIVIFSIAVTKSPWPLFLFLIYRLVLLGEVIMQRWGKWIRLVGWMLLVGGLIYLIYLLDRFPQIPPTP